VRILLTLMAAALATTAVASSASAESIISCDSALPTDTTITADNCRAWGIAPPPERPAFAYAPSGRSAFGYVPPRTKAPAAKRTHKK
jgi:hypothetical protein